MTVRTVAASPASSLDDWTCRAFIPKTGTDRRNVSRVDEVYEEGALVGYDIAVDTLRRPAVEPEDRTNLADCLMIEARDLFEVHLTVRNLDEAIAFYRDIVGLTLAHVTRGRQAAFLWIGAGRKAMLGLWAAGSAPQAVTLHTAFRVSWADVLAAPDFLRNAGVTPLDFDGRPTDLPVVLAWMPAAAVYFRDPDGHLLEYIAILPHEPRPDCGVVPWRTWELMQSSPTKGSCTRHHEQAGFA